MRAILLAAFAIALCGCGTAEEGESGRAGKDTTASATANPSAWYRRYTGTLGDKPIVAHLHRWPDGALTGTYFYASIGQPISLIYYADTALADSSHILFEDNAAGTIAARSTPEMAQWRLRLEGSRATGHWTGPGGTSYAIDLREDYSPDAVRLGVTSFRDSARLLPDHPRPQATASYYAVFPTGDNAGLAPFIDAEIRSELKIRGGISLEEGLRGLAGAYFAEYHRTLDSDARVATPEDLESFWMNYDESHTVSVLFNDRGWLVLEAGFYTYTGGAHGYGGSGFVNIDTRGKRTWRLTDVVADTAALKPFLTAAARTRVDMAEGVALTDHYFVPGEEIPVTANFYIAPAGLGFVYNPYEIASYAEGQVHLFLPYNRIGLLLTESFKARMGVGRSTAASGIRG